MEFNLLDSSVKAIFFINVDAYQNDTFMLFTKKYF